MWKLVAICLVIFAACATSTELNLEAARYDLDGANWKLATLNFAFYGAEAGKYGH